jgi:PAS domain S-box-containing protein
MHAADHHDGATGDTAREEAVRKDTPDPVDAAVLIEAAADAVVATDAQGCITFWNAAAERIFGFTRAQAIGATLDIIIPEKLRARHWTGWHETIRTRHTKYGSDLLKVPAVGVDGRRLSIAFTVALLPGVGKDAGPGGLLAVIRDETARFEEERALRKRVSELESALALTLARGG